MKELQTLSRFGESSVHHLRSNRCRKMGEKWFSRTREGKLMGPFRDRLTAEHASRNLVDFITLAPLPLRHSLQESLRH